MIDETIQIRDMQPEDEYFVSTCSHVSESEEADACGKRRCVLFRSLRADGARLKVALLEGEHAGFAYGLPIDVASWGPLGTNLMAIPCLYVLRTAAGRGIGTKLLESIEADARSAGFNGVTIAAYRDIPGAEWFMPAAYFEQLEYQVVDERGREVLLWKPFHDSAEPPRFLQPDYTYEPVPGRVAVDLFWNGFCPTSAIEAQRVREVAGEYGDRVILREYETEDRDTLLRYQIPRAIYVNGQEIGWGYEAPKEGIREAIDRALGGDG